MHDGSGIFLRDLPTLGASCRPRWSRLSPDRLSYIDGNSLKVLDGESPAVTLATFPEYESIDDRGEADTGPGDARVLVGDGKECFVFYPDTKQNGPRAFRLSDPFDSLMLTPDGNVLVSWLEKGTARHQGIELFDANMTFLRQVFPCNGHKATCRDADGSELLVITNSDDPAPIAPNAIVKVRLADGKQTGLLSLDWSIAVHISCPDQAGFAIVSTYQPGEPKDVRFGGNILRVPLDGDAPESLVEHGSRWFKNNTYIYEPKASVSRDGRKLVYASNMGRDLPDFADTYQLPIADDSAQTERRAGPRRLGLYDRRRSTSAGPDSRSVRRYERG